MITNTVDNTDGNSNDPCLHIGLNGHKDFEAITPLERGQDRFILIILCICRLRPRDTELAVMQLSPSKTKPIYLCHRCILRAYRVLSAQQI